MRTGRPKQALLLTEEERARLESMAHRARSQPLLARRARVVLACGEGLDNHAVARKLRCSLGMVGKWRARFVRVRLEGLYDEPRPGAPRKVSDEQVERVVMQTLESTPRGQTHWSTRELAKTAGLSRMTISRIWRAFGLQPHRSDTFKLMAAQAAPFSRSLHAHIRFVAASGGAMVRRTHEQTDPARRVPQGQRAGVGHSRIHQSPQRRSETICLDSNRRPDSGQHGSLRPPHPYFTSLQNYFTNQCDRRLGLYRKRRRSGVCAISVCGLPIPALG